MSKPRISVIIPHKDDEGGLRRCLESLASQTAGAETFEVVVVDNGSRADPSALVRSYSFARFAVETERGPGPARNRGVSLARAPLFAFLDSDCVASPDWVETALRSFEGSGERDVVGGRVDVSFAEPRSPTSVELFERVFAFDFRKYIEREGFTGAGNMLVPLSVFEEVGPFAGWGWPEDVDWCRRSRALGFAIRYVDELVVNHPGRRTFAELRHKWERLIAEKRRARGSGLKGRFRWALDTILVGVSPCLHVGRVLTTKKLDRFDWRLRACAVLFGIRLWRVGRMAKLLLSRPSPAQQRGGEEPGLGKMPAQEPSRDLGEVDGDDAR